jgi:hypothetical protein
MYNRTQLFAQEGLAVQAADARLGRLCFADGGPNDSEFVLRSGSANCARRKARASCETPRHSAECVEYPRAPCVSQRRAQPFAQDQKHLRKLNCGIGVMQSGSGSCCGTL